MTMQAEQAGSFGQETLPNMVGVAIPDSVTPYDSNREQSFGVIQIHVGDMRSQLGSVAEEAKSSEGTVIDYEPGGIRVYLDGTTTDPHLIDGLGKLANSAFLDNELADFLPKSLDVTDDFTKKILFHMVGFVAAESEESIDPAVLMSREILAHLGAITEVMEEGKETVRARFTETMARLNSSGVLMIKSRLRGPFGPLKTNLRSTALQESEELLH